MIPSLLKPHLPPDYWAQLEAAARSGDFSYLEKRYNDAAGTDPLMRPFARERKTKYYKPWVQCIAPKIIPAIKSAIARKAYPEIEVTFAELDSTRSSLGISDFGSPQDVLYAFAAERYADWGSTLFTMGFTSACMSKPTAVMVAMAPRYLEFGDPTEQIQELSGTISADFRETIRVVFGENDFASSYTSLCTMHGHAPPTLSPPTHKVLAGIRSHLTSLPTAPSAAVDLAQQVLSKKLEEFIARRPTERRISTFLRPAAGGSHPNVSQEQLVLKYVNEGNYLQKLLQGQRVEHIQSNIKMVRNELRMNKCEVDALYRVIGKNKIVLLEAKAKGKIARAQLWNIYETYRSRLPVDWELEVVAALLTEANDAARLSGARECIDLITIHTPSSIPETFTERLLSVTPALHYRWLVR